MLCSVQGYNRHGRGARLLRWGRPQGVSTTMSSHHPYIHSPFSFPSNYRYDSIPIVFDMTCHFFRTYDSASDMTR